MSAQQELKERYKSQGLCVDCGRPATVNVDGSRAVRCADCQRKHREGNRKSYIKYRGRVSERMRCRVEWKHIYGSHGIKRETPPITCPVCKVRISSDYWYCPWCGAAFPEPDKGDKENEIL